MANIYRTIKVYNGTGWDDIYPSVCRSITFGISSDYTSSDGRLVLNKTFAAGSPDYRDADTSLASLSNGNIAIKKTGRYLVVFNGELTVANITANPQFQIYCLQKH